MTEKFSRAGIPLQQFYSGDDFAGVDYSRDLGNPGDFPYTRGCKADLYGTKGWIQRALSGEGDPARSNKQLKYLISQGQMGIDIIGDSPTMAMMDPDHPLAAQAVGTQGVSLCCLEDYRRLYQDLPLESISVSSSLPPTLALAGLYLVARENSISPSMLRGSVLQTPFYAEDCCYAVHLPSRLRLRLAADSIEFCSREMPKFHSFVEDTYFFSESGLNVIEEMALGFIEIKHLTREVLKRGVDIDSFAPRIAILVNCSLDFFEEVAKLRATRRIFARMMKEEFGAKDPRSWAVVLTSHTSGLSLTAQQPFNNIVRGAIQTLCLVMGGVQALEISAFDEAYRTPSPESHMVGLRTQQVVHLETGVSRVTDPLGGSYYVEALTRQVEERILELIREIEARGDPADLAEQGWFKNFLHDAMERYVRSINNGDLKVVGDNIFRIPPEEDTLLKEVAEKKIEPCGEHIERIREYKRKRDLGPVKQSLRRLLVAGRSRRENLIQPIIEATAAGATLGEIAGTLRLSYDLPYDPYGLTESLI